MPGDRIPHLRGRQLAKVEVRRKHRGTGHVRQVALLLVARRRAGKIRQPPPGPGLAGLPCLAQPFGPVGRGGEQPPAVQRFARRPERRRRQGIRSRGGRRRWQMLRQRAPEGCVYLVQPAAAGRDRARRSKVIAVVAAQVELLGDRAFGVAPPGLVMPQAVDGAGTGLAADCRQFLVTAAPAQDQARAACAQRRVKAGQTVVQPPPGCGAHPAMLGDLVVEHIDRNHRAMLRRGEERRLIRDTQVAPQPDDCRIGHPPALPNHGRNWLAANRQTCPFGQVRPAAQTGSAAVPPTVQVWPLASSLPRSATLPARALASWPSSVSS